MAGAELEVIREHRPFEPFKWLPETLRLDFAEGIKMLQAAGREVCPACVLGCFLSGLSWKVGAEYIVRIAPASP